MNLEKEIIQWPAHYKPIPHPFYVVACDDHCMVCELDSELNLINEITVIHWNKYVVRKWALQIANERLKSVMEGEHQKSVEVQA